MCVWLVGRRYLHNIQVEKQQPHRSVMMLIGGEKGLSSWKCKLQRREGEYLGRSIQTQCNNEAVLRQRMRPTPEMRLWALTTYTQ